MGTQIRAGRTAKCGPPGPYLILQEQRDQRGEDPAHADGDGAHGALELTDLQGLSGPQGVTARADGQPLRHRVGDVEPLGKQGRIPRR